MSRAELHCNHNHEKESGERSLKKKVNKALHQYMGQTLDSPTDLRMLSHFTSSTSDRKSYKVTSDLFSKAYERASVGRYHVRFLSGLFPTHLNLKVDLFACAFHFIFSTVDIHLDTV